MGVIYLSSCTVYTVFLWIYFYTHILYLLTYSMYSQCLNSVLSIKYIFTFC